MVASKDTTNCNKILSLILERLLVYPYVPNGSAADRLRDTYLAISANYNTTCNFVPGRKVRETWSRNLEMWSPSLCHLMRFLCCLTDTGQENPSLDWSKRIHIALGVACGLVYLHEQWNPKIIHRDVKANHHEERTVTFP
ncbi:unnamed protein product [Coffea canephora]|uniref:DH200=94 genomic scaffold, scaffold_1619 n=1 Tax=Coffea canephora TaxID=49390 RepID=A0A068VIW2_COFCA|nr:unnamed protein product [Coffea canephora]